MDTSTYILNNFIDLCDEIEKPLKQTHRIRYTCFDASTNYIVLGATSGSIYIFQRNPCTFLQLIQNMYGPISHVAISPQEKFIAFSTVKGTICIYVVKLSAAYPQIVTSRYEDDSTTVLCLHWKRNEEQLYYGDANGNVFLVHLTSFLGRNLNHISIHPILYLEAPIVQITDFNQMLLVSNYEKCILCNMETEEFKQIGNKPRNGYYGACFISSNAAKDKMETKIICARPGCRLWTVDLDANVLQTSQFKSTTTPIAPYMLQTFNCAIPAASDANRRNATLHNTATMSPEKLPIIVQLPKLQSIFGRFVFAFTKNGFYIFDPSKSNLILWNNQFNDIQNIRVVNKNCLVIFTNTNKMYQLNVHSLEEVFVQLLEAKEPPQKSMELIMAHQEYFQQKLTAPLYVLHLVKLRQNLQDIGDGECCDELDRIFSDLSLNDTPKKCQHSNYGMMDHQQDNLMRINVESLYDQRHGKQQVPLLNNGKSHGNFEENIKSVILSTISEKFTKNILNKLNFFCETEQQNEQNANNGGDNNSGRCIAGGLVNNNAINNIKNNNNRTNLVMINSIAVVPQQQFNEIEIVNCPNNQHQQAAAAAADAADDDSTIEQFRQRQYFIEFNEITAEEKLLQNLFMVYKSIKMSGMQLVERYAGIFDQYDCDGIARLLDKLELLMCENGETMDEAKRHCFEMYFNYFNPDLLWELDNDSREFIINGFILVNSHSIINDLNQEHQHCTACHFPVLIKNSTIKHYDLAVTIYRYLWSRQQRQRCFDIACIVPQLLPILCRFYMQEDDRDMDKMILLLFACDNRQLFDEMANRRIVFNNQSPELLLQHRTLWTRILDTWRMVYKTKQISCGNCDVKNELPILGENLYSWSQLLIKLVDSVNGDMSLQYVIRYASDIAADEVNSEFFLKCLLDP